MIAYRLAVYRLYHTVICHTWMYMLIVDDAADVTRTFKAGVDGRNNNNDANKTSIYI